jgi:hypothetical protein
MGLGRDARFGVEARVGAAVQLGEIGSNAPSGVGMSRVHGPDLHHRGAEEPLDIGHRGHQALALAHRERC